jgi:hypothetical protein
MVQEEDPKKRRTRCNSRMPADNHSLFLQVLSTCSEEEPAREQRTIDGHRSSSDLRRQPSRRDLLDEIRTDGKDVFSIPFTNFGNPAYRVFLTKGKRPLMPMVSVMFYEASCLLK